MSTRSVIPNGRPKARNRTNELSLECWEFVELKALDPDDCVVNNYVRFEAELTRMFHVGDDISKGTNSGSAAHRSFQHKHSASSRCDVIDEEFLIVIADSTHIV